jgi:hypothetical protein
MLILEVLVLSLSLSIQIIDRFSKRNGHCCDVRRIFFGDSEPGGDVVEELFHSKYGDWCRLLCAN